MTAAVADRLAAEHAGVRVFHNGVTRGLGWNYRVGIGAARMAYVSFVNGKHNLAELNLTPPWVLSFPRAQHLLVVQVLMIQYR